MVPSKRKYTVLKYGRSSDNKNLGRAITFKFIYLLYFNLILIFETKTHVPLAGPQPASQ